MSYVALPSNPTLTLNISLMFDRVDRAGPVDIGPSDFSFLENCKEVICCEFDKDVTHQDQQDGRDGDELPFYSVSSFGLRQV